MASVAVDTPLAEALSSTIHQRIVEESWTTEDDTALAEYIVLMLANGKTQDQVAAELAGELLQDAHGTEEFAKWLFEQVAALSGSQAPAQPDPSASTTAPEQPEEPARETEAAVVPAAYEADMGDGAPDNAPKGPRGMHNSRGARGGRGGISKPDSALHRTQGNDRINSHMRGPPKGPRNVQNVPVRPGMQKAINGLMGQAQQPPQMAIMQQNGGMQAGPQMGGLTAEQQMQYMQMFEQQAQMMAQMMQMNQSMANGNRSLFDRVERGRGGRGGARGRGALHQNGSSRPQQGEGEQKEGENGAAEGQQQAQQASHDPFTIMCKFNTRCTNASCPYVHQSPAAPLNTPVDMSQTCSFGVACKSNTCIARHPSPAQKSQHQAQEQCRFWPNCTKPGCPFRHPQAPLCAYGASCKTENCKFTHLETPCHFNPCTNARCPYKHAPGQNRGFDAYSWTPAKKVEEKETDHVSVRKFVDGDAGPEELVKPEHNGNGNGVKEEPAATDVKTEQTG